MLFKVFKYAFVFKSCFFFLESSFHKKMIFELVEKTKQLYVFSIVIEYNPTSISNIWMSKGAHDIFALLIHFLGGILSLHFSKPQTLQIIFLLNFDRIF